MTTSGGLWLVPIVLAITLSARLAAAGQGSPVAGDSLVATDVSLSEGKNPELAGAISVFLPGMGHVYAGETTKGAVLTGLFVAGVGGIVASDIGQTHDSIRAGGWLSVGFVAAVYLYALIDAPFAAERTNEQSRSRLWRARQNPASNDTTGTGARPTK